MSDEEMKIKEAIQKARKENYKKFEFTWMCETFEYNVDYGELYDGNMNLVRADLFNEDWKEDVVEVTRWYEAKKSIK